MNVTQTRRALVIYRGVAQRIVDKDKNRKRNGGWGVPPQKNQIRRDGPFLDEEVRYKRRKELGVCHTRSTERSYHGVF